MHKMGSLWNCNPTNQSIHVDCRVKPLELFVDTRLQNYSLLPTCCTLIFLQIMYQVFHDIADIHEKQHEVYILLHGDTLLQYNSILILRIHILLINMMIGQMFLAFTCE